MSIAFVEDALCSNHRPRKWDTAVTDLFINGCSMLPSFFSSPATSLSNDRNERDATDLIDHQLHLSVKDDSMCSLLVLFSLFWVAIASFQNEWDEEEEEERLLWLFEETRTFLLLRTNLGFTSRATVALVARTVRLAATILLASTMVTLISRTGISHRWKKTREREIQSDTIRRKKRTKEKPWLKLAFLLVHVILLFA